MVALARYPKFPLGHTVATPGAIAAMAAANVSPITLLKRHIRGDWGDLSESDKASNSLALQAGYRILSAYQLHTGIKVWIITEADRSSTCILLPEEY